VEWVLAVAFSPDGKHIVSGSWDNTLRVWDAETGHTLFSLGDHISGVRAVAYSPDGMRIASAGSDEKVRVWDANTGQQLLTLEGHKEEKQCITFTLDGTRIISATSSNRVSVWDAGTGEKLFFFNGKPGLSVASNPDGSRLGLGSDDGTVYDGDLASGRVRLVGEHGPDFRILDHWDVPTAIAEGDLRAETDPSLASNRVFLVREADGTQTLGVQAKHFIRPRPSHCRAFLLEPEVVERLKALMGDKPWQHAFLAETVASSFDVARILSAAPELEGKVQGYVVVFDRVAVPQQYDRLPPRKQPLQVVIVFDTSAE